MMNLNRLSFIVVTMTAITLAGCHSSIAPLQPASIGPPWALRYLPAPTSRPGRAVATVPAHFPQTLLARTLSHAWFANARNGTSREITLTTYKNVWSQSIHLLIDMQYHIQWASYRLGIITTRFRTGPEILQWWRPDATTFPELMEGTINTFRRTVRLVITRTAQPHTFIITVEALVERRENPQGTVGNVAFFGASAFGTNTLPLQSHGAIPAQDKPYWMRVGHDPALERKILHRLFHKL